MKVIAMMVAGLALGGCMPIGRNIQSVGMRMTFADPAGSDLTLRYPADRPCLKYEDAYGNAREKCALNLPSILRGPL